MEQQCKEGQHLLRMNGRNYCIIPQDTPTTWDKAEATCQLIGGHLVTIETAEAFRELVSDWLPFSVLDQEEALWIGLNDRLVEGKARGAKGGWSCVDMGCAVISTFIQAL